VKCGERDSERGLDEHRLDSKEAAKLSKELADRLGMIGLRIPTISKIWDEHHVRENIHLTDPANRI